MEILCNTQTQIFKKIKNETEKIIQEFIEHLFNNIKDISKPLEEIEKII